MLQVAQVYSGFVLVGLAVLAVVLGPVVLAGCVLVGLLAALVAGWGTLAVLVGKGLVQGKAVVAPHYPTPWPAMLPWQATYGCPTTAPSLASPVQPAMGTRYTGPCCHVPTQPTCVAPGYSSMLAPATLAGPVLLPTNSYLPLAPINNNPPRKPRTSKPLVATAANSPVASPAPAPVATWASYTTVGLVALGKANGLKGLSAKWLHATLVAKLVAAGVVPITPPCAPLAS